MEMYGYTAPDFFGIDDLLDLSNDHIFSSSDTAPATTTTLSSTHHHHHSLPASSSLEHTASTAVDFTTHLCVPNEDVAELEWLSNFVDDSYTNFPVDNLAGTANSRSDMTFHGRSRSKRSRAPSTNNGWTSMPESHTSYNLNNDNNINRENNQNSPISSTSSSDTRRCTHCASEKTPQWRTGPLGPKTLCNACGVRYKSGRLVPEYRPAASPTFVLTQHSNSHRKVMELRRQKEEQQTHGHRHHHNFEVC